MEGVIRSCLIEFGWNREGTAWCDPDLGRFSEVYNRESFRYWVVADGADRAVGGAGIGGLTDRVCELQKMYCLPQVRGTGAARELMALCLAYAGQYYKQCYIETLHNMTAANRFYQKWGFRRLDRPLLDTRRGKDLMGTFLRVCLKTFDKRGREVDNKGKTGGR